MKKTEYQEYVAAAAFALIVALVCGFIFGYISGREAAADKETGIVYHRGSVPVGVPVVAFYDRGGTIDGVTAIASADGVLYPFSYLAGPLNVEMLPPDAWMVLDQALVTKP